jgi:hypothetical protein
MFKIVNGKRVKCSQEEIDSIELERQQEVGKSVKIDAERAYDEARADTTVIWNDIHTLRWHKARHWEDWHRMLSIGDGGDWYSEEGVLLNLTNSNVKQISKLIEANHRAAFAVYWAAVNP